ncbi:hypothetical protein C8035_v009638 [Colletotrichum spinosum]|uniref:Uncharacterized protein n=1 Tax=Colletotrichum spinosum TaxID=1347390 RepID=A0A4R8Q6E6_9PEZI|nr:hypothetical protein C8035_v009638 [Colletotrichum spinosum]
MAPLSSELMTVSREARHAAEQFYPVKMPCYVDRSLGNDGVELIETELPLNMSFDYFNVDGPSDLVPYLFKHVQECDPQGQGIQHLVLNGGEKVPRPAWLSPPYLVHFASSLGSSPSIAELGAAAISSYVKNIRSIWFTGSVIGGRAIDATTYISNKSNSFNYSLPLYPEFTFFDTPRRDPRPVHRDLSAVPTNDTKTLDRTWLADNLKYRTGIALPNLNAAAIDFRLMVASLPGSTLVNTGMPRPRTQTREQASDCLHMEDFTWIQWLWSYHGWDSPNPDGLGGGFLPAGCFGTASGLRPRPPRFDGPEVLATVPRPALGFWLFPLDESKDGNGPYHPGYMRSYDGLRNLSGHWPDLALAHLRS